MTHVQKLWATKGVGIHRAVGIDSRIGPPILKGQPRPGIQVSYPYEIVGSHNAWGGIVYRPRRKEAV